MPVISCPDCNRDVSTMATACPHCGRPSPASTTPVGAPAAPAGKEQTLWHGTPSPTLLAGHIAGMVVVLVAIPLLAIFFSRTASDPEAGAGLRSAGWVITAILLAIQLTMFLVAWMRLRSTMYTITNQRVLIEQGIFTKSVDEIDLRYVDDSQFVQTFVDRILGIGNVTLISSDKTTPRYMLRSIKDPRGVREIIRAEAYQSSQRQIFTRAT
jgi:uncharacterized membrane protein YdbT with pleckstrin-like domain